MRVLLFVACLALGPGLHGQSWSARPEVTARQIGAASGGSPGWLWPEELYSVYGANLGPEQACVLDAGGYRPQGPNAPGEYDRLRHILPSDLCSVLVLLDEEPAPLQYVQSRQINFLVPRAGAGRDRIAVRVVYRGVSSIPVLLKFGPDRVTISQDGEAYTGMPVWIRVSNRTDPSRTVQLRFGLTIFPDCPHIEVKAGELPVAQQRHLNPPSRFVYSGPPCPAPSPDRRSLAGRVPLHLIYVFDRPGFYRVRYVPESYRIGGRTEAASEWTTVHVKAGNEAARAKWLQARVAAAPTDREGLIYDFLPSIVGYGDVASLRVALKYLYDRDAAVAGVTASYLLTYYPSAMLAREIEPLAKAKGRNAAVTRVLAGLGLR